MLAILTKSDDAQDFAERDGFSIAWSATVGIAFFACLYVSSLYSYLLFHGIAEIFSISVCFCIFVITLNSRQFLQNGYLLFIGLAYFFVGIIDGVHTLAYKGMGVFHGYDANLPTQLWIAARYLQSISLLVAPVFFRKKPNLAFLFLFYAAISATLLIAIFSGLLFPDCFVEGVGLTSFKIISEYLISVILLVSLLILSLNRDQFDSYVYKLLAASIIVTILSELAFTYYVSVYGFFNLVGHFLKILAFYLVYKAIVQTGLKKPYSLIFRELHEERQNLKAEVEQNLRLQKELESSEERYRTVADFAYDWEYWINPEGRFVYISPSCERVTGYTTAEFFANPDLLADIVLDEDRQLFQQHLESQTEKPDSAGQQAIDFRIRRKNGETRWIAHVSQAIYVKEQQFLGTRASNRDITERKSVERELQESEEKFAKVFQSAPVMITLSNVDDGTFIEVNDKFCKVSGFSREESLGKTSIDLGWVSQADRIRLIEEVQAHGSVRGMELELRTRDKRNIYVIYDGEFIQTKNGRMLLSIAQDVTERKFLEEERMETQRKLLHARKLESLGIMAGGIAHDFNNQLAVILGNLELGLMDLPPDSGARASIINAVRAAKRSAELARQMLVYTGNTFYYPVDLNLDELLNNPQDLLKSQVSKNVTLKLEKHGALPTTKGDPDQIRRLIANVVSNAFEAIGDKGGDVTIRTGVMECDEAYLRQGRLQEKPEPGRFVFLEVSDTGSGMDPETQYKLFDPFFSTKFWGRGLGMAEVAGILKGHQGAIMLDSEIGKGSTIRILFPAEDAPKM